MDEPLLPKEQGEVATRTLPFQTQVLVLVAVPTVLAFLALTVLATLPLLVSILGLGCMLMSGLAAVVLALGVFLVENRRDLLMESRYVVGICVVSGVSESVLWVLAGLLTSSEVVAPIMAVGVGIQLTLTLLSLQESLPTGSGVRLAAGLGVVQTALVLFGAPRAPGWILIGSVAMILSNVFKAEKAQRLAIKRYGDGKSAALCALLLQHRNCKKVVRGIQALVRRVQPNRQE